MVVINFLTKGICVTKKDTTERRGTILLNILKQLASILNIKQIAILSLPKAKTFYEKNGFIEEDEGTKYMIINIEEGITYFNTKSGGKKSSKKNKRKKYEVKKLDKKKIQKIKNLLIFQLKFL